MPQVHADVAQEKEEGTAPIMARRHVGLDLDETTGSWGLGSLAFQVWTTLGQDPQSLVRPFVDMYMVQGGARPHLCETLQTLQRWLQQGRINEVFIFTAASNHNGWVDFLKQCMEEYAGTSGLFGRCVSRCHISSVKRAANGAYHYAKDLSLISPYIDNVLLIDDKPDYVANGLVLGVPEYEHRVDMTELTKWIKTALPMHTEKIDAVFAEDAMKHPPTAVADCSGDMKLAGCVKVLEKQFPPRPNLGAVVA